MDSWKTSGFVLRMVAVILLSLFSACGGDESEPAGSTDLESLPKDTGGTHTPYVVGSTSAKFGYYVYLPGGYNDVNSKYPLLVFLHGKDERGDGSNSQTVLDKVLRNGPPKLIKNGQWNPTYPMVVVSPQYHDDGSGGNVNNWGAGKPENLRNFIQYMIDNYRINEKRVYLTGLSHGGNGVYDCLIQQDESVSLIAAAVPVAAYGPNKGYAKHDSTPIWVFVGDKDEPNFTTSKNFVSNYNSQSPAPLHQAKITIFNNAGHDVWTRTYNSGGMGTADPDFDLFDMTIYDWMFQYERQDF